MRLVPCLVAGAALVAAAASCPVLAADLDPPGEEHVLVRLRQPPAPRAGFRAAVTDTVYFGYKAASSDPNKVGAGIGHVAGGKWDFDTGIAGTDSTQYWRFLQRPQASDPATYTTPAARPFWYFDYGNNIDIGNHALWKARALARRSFRRTGLAGVWHVDDMATVPGSAGNIAGTRSAWCGLRYTGDPSAPIDELTGNPYTNAEQLNDFRGGGAVRSAFPGYADLWNQLLYRDYLYSGAAVPVSFRVRATLSTVVTTDTGGSAWFSPDPTSSSNLVLNPADSLMVWVGARKETGVYDTNRRYLSEVLDFSLPGAAQPQKIFAASGRLPRSSASGNDTTITTGIPAGAGWGGIVRLVFQVHTNRTDSDLATTPSGFNSPDGAVVLDDVWVGGHWEDFDHENDVRPRVLLSRLGIETAISPTSTWITTGRPPAWYGHIHSANDLPYDDPCGGLDGSGSRLCNLAGNVLVQSNHDDAGHAFHRESQSWAVSPTICLSGPRAVEQGAPPDLRATASHINLRFDYYSGFDDIYVTGVFFWYAVRYMGTGLTSLSQVAAPQVANWSPFNAPGVISSYGTPTCMVVDSGPDLIGYVPIASVDSLQIALENQTRCGRFGATACGETRGSYWDNLQVGFVRGAATGPTVSTYMWWLYGDTFPFTEIVPPGSVAFDTTTALVKGSVNNGRSSGGEGVVPGDTLVYTSAYAGNDARVDLVFRIWPGPGNYAGRNVGAGAQAPWALRHNRILKVPAVGDVAGNYASAGDGSFWGAYMADNGEVGSTPSGHTATYWDPQTWNSARMDSAQWNYYPIQLRNIGVPSVDTWMGTYHELDPKYAGLGIARDLCFLVNPAGPNDHTNTCCSAAQCAGAPFYATWPPSGYGSGAQTSTVEGTKILPDGLLTPGTHVQYFVRRSAASDPSVLQSMAPDTTTVTFQGGMGGSTDCTRYDHFDVFPDLWKDTRFGGSGLACMLYIDGADRRGYEPAVRGTLDSLGFGLDNGAARGWRQTLANLGNIDDPSGFIPENLGQVGLAYDQYDVRAAEAEGGDRPGCRIVGGGISPGLVGKQCKAGPTPAMLDYYYNTILWDSGDLHDANGALHDCSGLNSEQACDAVLLNSWLDAAGPDDVKALLLSGDGLAQDLAVSGTPSMDALALRLGMLFQYDSYYFVSGNLAASAVFRPLDADPGPADPFHSTRRYGFFNSCQVDLDIIDRNAAVAGAERAARYEDYGDRGTPGVGAGPYYASVYRRRDPGAGRYYATLIDGFALDRLRSWNGTGDPTTQNYSLTFNNHAQQAWVEDALSSFNLCARVMPAIAVGELPGLSALNFVRGAAPNPAVSGTATVRFTLARAAPVTLRFYNVAGRLVHEVTVDGRPGENAYRWDGATTSGIRAGSGVYFYRLSAPGIEFENNQQRMVLLGRAD